MLKMLKLGTMVTDTATGLEGMATHLLVEMNGNEYICFQPRGLNPKTQQPVATMWLIAERLAGGEKVDALDLPRHVLGTIVEDKASGFKGTAVSMCLHINGCVHFNVQPKGVQETGAPIETCNFDIRRLTGAAIKPMTAKEQAVDEKKRPSPAGDGCHHRAAPGC